MSASSLHAASVSPPSRVRDCHLVVPHRLELSWPPARPPHLAPPLTCSSCPRPLLPSTPWFQLPCAHHAPGALRASGALVLMGDRGLLVGRDTPTHHLDLSSKALLPEPPPSPSCLPTVSFLPCAPPDFQLLPLCAPDSAAMGSPPDVCCLPHSPSCLTQSGVAIWPWARVRQPRV